MSNDVTDPTFSRPIHEAIFWRGVFVHHYGAIEQCVTELLIVGLSDPNYSHLGKVPGNWPEKLKRLSKIVDHPGPLARYSDPLRYQLSTISIIEPHRHLLVHGVMTLPPEDNPQAVINFMMHDAWKQCRNELAVSMDDLKYLAQELGGHSKVIAQMIAEMLEVGGFSRIALGKPSIVKLSRRDI